MCTVYRPEHAEEHPEHPKHVEHDSDTEHDCFNKSHDEKKTLASLVIVLLHSLQRLLVHAHQY